MTEANLTEGLETATTVDTGAHQHLLSDESLQKSIRETCESQDVIHMLLTTRITTLTDNG